MEGEQFLRLVESHCRSLSVQYIRTFVIIDLVAVPIVAGGDKTLGPEYLSTFLLDSDGTKAESSTSWCGGRLQLR